MTAYEWPRTSDRQRRVPLTPASARWRTTGFARLFERLDELGPKAAKAFESLKIGRWAI